MSVVGKTASYAVPRQSVVFDSNAVELPARTWKKIIRSALIYVTSEIKPLQILP